VRWIDRLLEGCWLFALVCAPLYFNPLSARHFEPDKTFVVRSVVLLMAALSLARLVAIGSPAARSLDLGHLGARLRLHWRDRPALVVVPTVLYVVVFLFSTATSVLPRISLWGSYERLQGTYTILSCVVFAGIVGTMLRTRPPIERIVTIVTCTGLVVAGYTLVQHLGLDPFPWRFDVVERGTSTLGNPLSVGSYLAMVAPFALYRLAEAVRQTRTTRPEAAARRAPAWRIASEAFVLCSVLGGAVLTQSRGALIALGAGIFVFVALTLQRAARGAPMDSSKSTVWRRALVAWSGLACAVLLLLVAINLAAASGTQSLRALPYVGRLADLAGRTTVERRLIWFGDAYAGGAWGLITADPVRTVIGWGPETMLGAYNRFYPPSLAILVPTGSPDRAHMVVLDELITRGLLGLATYLGVLTGVALFWRRLWRAPLAPWQSGLLAAVCASLVSTLIDGLTGIPILATLLLFWTIVALVVALSRIADDPAESPSHAEPPPVDASRPRDRRARPRQPDRPRTRERRRVSAGRVASGARVAGVSVLLVALALVGIWRFNLQPLLADMAYQQGKLRLAQNDGAGGSPGAVIAFWQSVRANPTEDVYFSGLSQSLYLLAEARRLRGAPPGDPIDQPNIEQVVSLADPIALTRFVDASSALALMSYADAALEHAHRLNPLNKDHPLNLGRLNRAWFAWTADPSRLERALTWYRIAAAIAPTDVVILNEEADATIQTGRFAVEHGDMATAARASDRALSIIQQSQTFAPDQTQTSLLLARVAELRAHIPASRAEPR